MYVMAKAVGASCNLACKYCYYTEKKHLYSHEACHLMSDELLELFTTLKEHGVTILFSTHITSDLERCADNIVYIRQGAIRADCSKADFLQSFGKDGESLEEIFLRMEREART